MQIPKVEESGLCGPLLVSFCEQNTLTHLYIIFVVPQGADACRWFLIDGCLVCVSSPTRSPWRSITNPTRRTNGAQTETEMAMFSFRGLPRSSQYVKLSLSYGILTYHGIDGQILIKKLCVQRLETALPPPSARFQEVYPPLKTELNLVTEKLSDLLTAEAFHQESAESSTMVPLQCVSGARYAQVRIIITIA
jgi:hypothetical protein